MGSIPIVASEATRQVPGPLRRPDGQCEQLQRACTDRHRLQHANPKGDLELCVNVSPHQLLAPGFCGTVEQVLAATETPAQLLTLEMTESVYVEDTEPAQVVLGDLKGLGVQLALDDFGTGYSALGYLEQFPIDTVKIDQGISVSWWNEPRWAAPTSRGGVTRGWRVWNRA